MMRRQAENLCGSLRSTISLATNPWSTFALLRILQATLLVTFLAPDEYYQAMEPGHLLVFGSGDLPWEFKPESRLRSWTCCLPSAISFYILKITGLDFGGRALVTGARLIHALLAAYGDAGIHKAALELFGYHGAIWGSIFSALSWFNGSVLVRALPSSLGACLSTAALAHWFESNSRRKSDFPSVQRFFAAFLIGLAAVSHPPACLPWAILGVPELISVTSNIECIRFLAECFCGLSSALVCVMLSLNTGAFR